MNDAAPAHVGLLRGAGGDWRESSALPSVLLTFTRDLNIHREPFHSHGSILMWTEELGRWLLCRQIKDCNQSVESIVLKVCWERWMNESRGFLSSPRCFLLSCEWVGSSLWCEPTWNLVPVSRRLFYGRFWPNSLISCHDMSPFFIVFLKL